MATIFPSNPTIGQVYTSNGFSWRWDGVGWTAYGSLQNALERFNLAVNTNFTDTTVYTSSASVIDSFDKALYKTAEYTIQIAQGGNYRSSKVLLLNDGTSIKHTEYAILSTGTAIVSTLTSTFLGNNAVLRIAIPTAGTTEAIIKVSRIAM
jgi:hypothetical protein